MADALQLDRLTVNYGGILAVDGVDVAIGEGQLVGLIGPNGAGKTTLFDAISGLVPHLGRIVLRGRDLSVLGPEARARAGVGRSFQDARLFPGLSVRETLAFALHQHLQDPGAAAQVLGWPTARGSERVLAGQVDELVELFGLGGFADKFLSELSTGTRRVVDLACVYARQPAVILLDEPSSGIAQREVEALASVIRRLHSMAGATMIVVEHDIPLIRDISERLLVMDYGRLLADGPPDEVLARPDVVTSYLGTDESAVRRSGAAVTGSIVAVEQQLEADTADSGPPPGLPPSDDFRLPARSIAEALVASAAALLVAPFLLAGAAAPARQAAATGPVASATPSPVPGPSLAPPPALSPSAGLPSLSLPSFSFPSLSSGGSSFPVASASPSPSPEAFPCAGEITPLPTPPAPLPPLAVPTPLVSPTACPLASPSPSPSPAAAAPAAKPTAQAPTGRSRPAPGPAAF